MRLPETAPRFRVQHADFRQHVDEVLVADAADLAQRGKIAAGQKIEMLQKRGHGGIEAVPLPKLDGKAFAQRAGENSRRIERLQLAEDRLDLASLLAETLCDRSEAPTSELQSLMRTSYAVL